ncbi:MAG: hypothetical protein BWK79_14680 [Beggiatoa sp. IS2]|nr:MAG: hypothetical protein BWK79_14680 [Beggiatoa sp. IS2]
MTLYLIDLYKNEAIIQRHVTDHVSILSEIVTGELKQVVSDLLFLSEYSAEYQEHRANYHQYESVREAELKYYIAFSKNRKIYDQIRFLELTGEEMLRVRYNDGQPAEVPKSQLQSVAPDIFPEIAKLSMGEIYMSPFSLSVENGEITIPLKPNIQLGMPIFCKDNQKMGIILLDYSGERLLRHFTRMLIDAPGQIMLLNADGYWIKSGNSTDEWGFILKERQDRQFQNIFPEEWQRISTHETAQFISANGLFTFLTLYPHTLIQHPLDDSNLSQTDYWKIVSYVPSDILYEESQNFLNKLIIIYIPLIIFIGIGALMLSLINRRRQLAEQHLREQYISYARFIPHEFLKLLKKRRFTDIKLADHIQQDMTIFFSDIRSYTKLSESMSPRETFHFLNTYFMQVDPVIKKNSGFIDKFIGDAIMAIFPESPHDALSSVIEIKHQLDIYNEGRKQAGYHPVQVGFGLHCGEVTLGTVGTPNRMETTVIGDTVNLASRIESLTKVFKVDIIFSDCVYNRLPENHGFNVREIDTVRVRGKQRPVVLYEAFDTNEPTVLEEKRRGLPLFQQAIAYYKAGDFGKAMALFNQCQELCPEDTLPPIYIKRCNALLRVPPGPDWAGISTL